MGYHSSACDWQFSLKHQCCRNPIGRDEIPGTSKQAYVGIQWPTAGMRNTEMQRMRWRFWREKLFWNTSSFMPWRSGHGCHTLMKYPFISPNSSLQHAWLQTVLVPVDPCPEQGLWVTATVSITCENTPVGDTMYKTQIDIKWGSRWGLSLCIEAHAFTYMVHVGRNPAWSLTTLDPCRFHITLRSPAGEPLMLHSNISFANFSCRIQLN